MPHSPECREKVRSIFGDTRLADDWCGGEGCTMTREDYPELFELFELLDLANRKVTRGEEG